MEISTTPEFKEAVQREVKAYLDKNLKEILLNILKEAFQEEKPDGYEF